MVDLVIKDGTLVDGAGGTPYTADLAVVQGRIAAIGERLNLEAKTVVDAAGCLVTPGFIDIHRHGDYRVFSDEFGEIELRQGITSIVNGNCGHSLAPCPPAWADALREYLRPSMGAIERADVYPTFAGYLDALAARPLPLHVGCAVGNGTLRVAEAGFSSQPLDAGQIKQIQRRLQEALDAGALGVTCGIIYIPESFYSTEELLEVLQPLRGKDIPLTTHIRDEANGLHPALREVIRVARALEAPLHISHFKQVGRDNWGQGMQGAIRILDEARASGVRVTCDVYPYTAGSALLQQLLPQWVQEGGAGAMTARLSERKLRRQLTEELERKKRDKAIDAPYSWEDVMVSSVVTAKNKPCVGMRLTEIARERGVSDYDALFDLLVEEHGQVMMINFVMDEADMNRALQLPYSSLISDSVYPASGLPHPRIYGAFPRLLARYVRDEKLLDLPKAIRKMTSMPAEVYRIAGKGLLQVGYDADINVLDLAALSGSEDFLSPKRLATGFRAVIVAGERAVENDRYTPKGSGRVLRRG